MSFSLKNLISSPASTAEVVNGYLILSLPNAIEPIVWRMALDKIGTAAFEVKQEDNSNITKLTLKPKKGTAEIIASFTDKDKTMQALMAASRALQTAPPKSVTTTPLNTSQKRQHAETQTVSTSSETNNGQTETHKWIIAVFGVLIVLGLYYYLTTLIPTTNIGFGTQNTAATATTEQSTGVPVSADDFLRGL